MVRHKQQAARKQLEIAGQVFRWIGWALLAILLVLAVVFQAPWKVITLLLVLLIACTILPRRFRKFFWLSVGATVVTLIIWVFLPEDNEGWQPYTFDAELAALEARYGIPDFENAAVIYNKLLEEEAKHKEPPPKQLITELLYKGESSMLLEDVNNFLSKAPHNHFYPEFWNDDLADLTLNQFWSSAEYPEVAEWLKAEHEERMDRLMKASRKNTCWFGLKVDMFDPERTNRNVAMRGWGRLMVRSANNDVAEGRAGSGIKKYLCAIQIGRHVCQQPTASDALAGISIQAEAIRQLKRFVVTQEAAEGHLATIEAAIRGIKHDWSSDLPRILEYEKLIMKNMLCGMLYQISAQGKTRLNRAPTAIVYMECAQEIPKPGYWQRKLGKARCILGWLSVPATPQQAGRILDTNYERFYAMAKSDFDWVTEPDTSLKWPRFNFAFMGKLLTMILEPTYRQIHNIYLRAAAQQKGSSLIISLRRYKNKDGVWPQSLDEIEPHVSAEALIDPFNDGPFVYRLTEDAFTLYSKGHNGIDENGKYRDPFDDWPIWPPRSRKTKTKE